MSQGLVVAVVLLGLLSVATCDNAPNALSQRLQAVSKSEEVKRQIEGEQNKMQTGVSSSSMLGSLAGVGEQAVGSTHALFTPPYSWMWRVGMEAASLKYNDLGKVADVPELMNLITGYYAHSPDALAAAKKAEDANDKFSIQSLTNHFLGTPTEKKNMAGKAMPGASSSSSSPHSSQSAQSAHSSSSSAFAPASPYAKHTAVGGIRSAPKSEFESVLPSWLTGESEPTKTQAKRSTNNFGLEDDDDDDDEEEPMYSRSMSDAEIRKKWEASHPQPKGMMSSLMDMVTGEDSSPPKMPAAKKTPHAPKPETHPQSLTESAETMAMDALMNAMTGSKAGKGKGNTAENMAMQALMGVMSGDKGKKGKGGGGVQDMVTDEMMQMGGKMLGVDPSMMRMAAPLISNMM